jgi:hypothetical protein
VELWDDCQWLDIKYIGGSLRGAQGLGLRMPDAGQRLSTQGPKNNRRFSPMGGIRHRQLH